MIAFMNAGPAAAPLVIRARQGLAPFTPKLPSTRWRGVGESRWRRKRRGCRSGPTRIARSSTFRTTRPRTRSASITTTPSLAPASGHYFNVVRAGSTVSNPSAVLLDTGEKLKVETIVRRRAQETRPRCRRAGHRHHADRRHLVSRGEAGAIGAASDHRNLHRSRTATCSMVTSWCGIAPSAGRETPSCCPRGGRWSPVRSRPRFPPTLTAVSGLSFENGRNDDIQVLIRARRIKE